MKLWISLVVAITLLIGSADADYNRWKQCKIQYTVNPPPELVDTNGGYKNCADWCQGQGMRSGACRFFPGTGHYCQCYI